MELLEKRITADWIDIRDKMTSVPRMKAYLELPDEALGRLAENLRGCTLLGPVEFKKKVALGVFAFLSRLSHQTPSQDEMNDRLSELNQLVFLNCLENQFATGILKPQRETQETEILPKGSSLTFDQVLHDVALRLRAQPELGREPHVKNLITEIQLYKNEYAQFKLMSPKIPDERAAGFFSNFKQRIEAISKTIYNYYQELLEEEKKAEAQLLPKDDDDMFLVAGLGRLLTAQTKELSLVRSTISHAVQEGYQIRGLLLTLVTRKDPLLALVDEEAKLLSISGHQRSAPELLSRLAKDLASAVERTVHRV